MKFLAFCDVRSESCPFEEPQMEPRWPHDGPKRAEDEPKLAPRWPQDDLKTAKDGPRFRPPPIIFINVRGFINQCATVGGCFPYMLL